MKSQAREMGRLTKDILQAAEIRNMTLDSMRAATKSALSACASMRGKVAHDYRARTQKFLAGLARDVAADRRAVTQQMARVSGARHKAAGHMRDSLDRQVASIVEKTAALRDAATNAVANLANAHRSMAKHQRAALSGSRRKLHADTARFVGAMHKDRMKAHEIWSGLKFGRAA